MERVRIIYHPAPGIAPNGELVEVEPIDLGTEPSFALGWIRRRLGLVGQVDEQALRFRAEVVPMPLQSATRPAVDVLMAGGPDGEDHALPITPSPARRSRLGRSKPTSAEQSPISGMDEWTAPTTLDDLPTPDDEV